MFFLLKHVAITESGRIVGSPLPKSHEDQVIFVEMCKALLASSHVQKSASNEKKLHSAIARSDRLQPRPKHVNIAAHAFITYNSQHVTCEPRRDDEMSHTILLYFPGRTGKPIGMADTLLACT